VHVTAEPLHVRVARVLGWTEIHEETQGRIGGWFGTAPAGTGPRWWTGNDPIPPYGEDAPEGWACTGPLQVRYKIDVWRQHWTDREGGLWIAGRAEDRHIYIRDQEEDVRYRDAREAQADSPCEAVAWLIVELHEAGRLKP
jgi:hypothetical protein